MRRTQRCWSTSPRTWRQGHPPGARPGRAAHQWVFGGLAHGAQSGTAQKIIASPLPVGIPPAWKCVLQTRWRAIAWNWACWFLAVQTCSRKVVCRKSGGTDVLPDVNLGSILLLAFWAWLAGGSVETAYMYCLAKKAKVMAVREAKTQAMEEDFWLASKKFWHTIRWLWKWKQGSA